MGWTRRVTEQQQQSFQLKIFSLIISAKFLLVKSNVFIAPRDGNRGIFGGYYFTDHGRSRNRGGASRSDIVTTQMLAFSAHQC